MINSYNSNRPPKTERLNPPIYHSRYVHLKMLNKNMKSVMNMFLKDTSFTIVDFGCGEAPHQELLSEYCSKYIPVDIPGNPHASHFVNLETNKCNLPNSVADIVWSIQVLEHVSDYQAYLEEANRILKPGGLIIASTHGQWKYHPDPIDYWRWTSEGLKQSFLRSKFEVVHFRGSMSFLSVSLQLFQDAVLLSLPLVKVWQKPFCLMVQIGLSFTEWFSRQSKTLNKHRNIDSDIYFVVGRKSLS